MPVPSARPPQRIAMLLIDGFALMSLSAAIEPLRAANLLAGRELYHLTFVSVDCAPARASAGMLLEGPELRGAGFDYDYAFVVAGGDPLRYFNPALDGWLRRARARRMRLGGISGGAVILARAGLLASRRFTVHWQHFDALRAESADHLMERRLYVIDRDSYTCAGGVAPLDMMHAMIASDHGAGLARRVSDWFIHTGIRPAQAPQRAGPVEQYGIHNPALIAAIELMATHIADPLSAGQLAALAGIGERQLQRLFTAEIGAPMMAFYRDLRLETAEKLLTQTSLSVTEVGLATGFANPAHFARVYRVKHGHSPGHGRKRPSIDASKRRDAV